MTSAPESSCGASVLVDRRKVARRLGPVTVLACAALGMLAGCGGGGSGVPTKAQYIAKANAICVEEQQTLTQVALTKGQLIAKVVESNHARQQALAKLEAVKPPRSEAITPEWLALRRRAIAASNKVAAAGLETRTARQQSRVFYLASESARRIALGYGLKSCKGFAAT